MAIDIFKQAREKMASPSGTINTLPAPVQRKIGDVFQRQQMPDELEMIKTNALDKNLEELGISDISQGLTFDIPGRSALMEAMKLKYGPGFMDNPSVQQALRKFDQLRTDRTTLSENQIKQAQKTISVLSQL
jgi:hypothetical protein